MDSIHDIMKSIEDSLIYLFDIQRFHNRNCWNINLPVDVQQEVKLHMEYILGIFHNSTKLLNEYKWKDNLIEIESVDKHSIIEHSGDVLKYIISLMLLHNIDPIDFITSYVEKYDITLKKVNDREKLLSKNTKIAAFDIDGVIMNYAEEFFSFMKDENLIPQNLQQVNGISPVSFARQKKLRIEVARMDAITSHIDKFIETHQQDVKVADAIYYKALLTDMKVDARALRDEDTLKFYYDIPSAHSETTWQDILNRFADTDVAIEARWRLAWLKAGRKPAQIGRASCRERV